MRLSSSFLTIARHIPNAITCGNLLCGCLAILKAFEGDLHACAYLVGIAAVLDFLDGFAARLLKAQSPIGKDLDSLADMVTFGVVPGMVTFKMIAFLTGTYVSADLMEGIRNNPEGFLPYAGLIIIIFSAIRLATFNNDTRQTTDFIGLPTPANAILICSLPLVYGYESYQNVNASGHFLMDPYNLAIMACILSLLLVTELRLFSLKFKSFGWPGNEMRYTFLACAATLIILFGYAGIPMTIVFYIVLSIVDNIFSKKEV